MVATLILFALVDPGYGRIALYLFKKSYKSRVNSSVVASDTARAII
jgi:hypothetical protein